MNSYIQIYLFSIAACILLRLFSTNILLQSNRWRQIRSSVDEFKQVIKNDGLKLIILNGWIFSEKKKVFFRPHFFPACTLLSDLLKARYFMSLLIAPLYIIAELQVLLNRLSTYKEPLDPLTGNALENCVEFARQSILSNNGDIGEAIHCLYTVLCGREFLNDTEEFIHFINSHSDHIESRDFYYQKYLITSSIFCYYQLRKGIHLNPYELRMLGDVSFYAIQLFSSSSSLHDYLEYLEGFREGNIINNQNHIAFLLDSLKQQAS